MLDVIADNQPLLFVLTCASAAMLVATAIVAPALAVRIPDDYFLNEERPTMPRCDRCLASRVALLVAKNAAGVVLVATGIAMIVLPGPGLLVIVLGVLLLNFPGKYRVERWLFSRGPVRRPINWLRARAGRCPLRVERAQAAIG